MKKFTNDNVPCIIRDKIWFHAEGNSSSRKFVYLNFWILRSFGLWPLVHYDAEKSPIRTLDSNHPDITVSKTRRQISKYVPWESQISHSTIPSLLLQSDIFLTQKYDVETQFTINSKFMTGLRKKNEQLSWVPACTWRHRVSEGLLSI